jgi:hypothetical protein
LEGLLIFLGKEVMARAGKVKQPPDTQISYVLPITQVNFREMLRRIQKQSNMTVRSDPTQFVIQKFADEGSSSPFMARIFMGIMRLRDAVFPDASSRQEFDKAYEFVMMTLLNARTVSNEITHTIHEHVRRVSSGEIARIQGPNIHVDETVDRELRKEVENFLNLAVRVLKHGMQQLTSVVHVNIGFLFKDQNAFQNGKEALFASDPNLATYLGETRKWSERLIENRNAIEHKGWMLPRVVYSKNPVGVQATEPHVSGQKVSEYVEVTLDRLCCFVEEVTAHCLQSRMPAGISVTELLQPRILQEMPERFQLTLHKGGMPIWTLGYHDSKFEET